MPGVNNGGFAGSFGYGGYPYGGGGYYGGGGGQAPQGYPGGGGGSSFLLTVTTTADPNLEEYIRFFDASAPLTGREAHNTTRVNGSGTMTIQCLQ